VRASLTCKATHTDTPPYLSRLLLPYRPSRVLRSSSSPNHLQVRHNNLIFGSCTIHAGATTIWNSLYLSLFIWQIQLSGGTLKQTLSKQLLTPPAANSDASDSLMQSVVLCKCFYLVTYPALCRIQTTPNSNYTHIRHLPTEPGDNNTAWRLFLPSTAVPPFHFY